MKQKFIHLRAQSSYSLLESTIKIPKLIDLALSHKMPAIAMTDRNNLFGALEFSTHALKKGVQPINGIILNVWYRFADVSEMSELVLLAKNAHGTQNLLKIASSIYLKSIPNSPLHISMEELEAHKDGIIAISSCQSSVPHKFVGNKYEVAKSFASWFKEVFGEDCYFEIRRAGAAEVNEALYHRLAEELAIPLVATNCVLFGESRLHEAHDVLLCIAQGVKSFVQKRQTSNPEHYFKTQEQMYDLFTDDETVLRNSWIIAQKCSSCFYPSDPDLPNFGDANQEKGILSEKAYAGLEKRLSSIGKLNASRDSYFAQLEYELGVICQMKFAGYFLIVSDFINWSKKNGITVGPGRGSGAGSMVAWSLGITDLDPFRFGLIFERFLNPERISMPDFDIDFCQARRDEVLKYVIGKYGQDKVAHIITFGSMQAKGVIKDVSRVLNVPYRLADYVTELIPFNAVSPVTLPEAIDSIGELKQIYHGEGFYNPDALGLSKDPEEVREFNKLIRTVLEIALELEGVQRHVSTHAAGIVISGKKLTDLVPLYADKGSDLHIIQYSMKYAELAGLVKFDFLGLQTLTLISNCLSLLAKDGTDIEIQSISLEEKAVYSMLSKGHTVGVFQFESAGMREAIKRLMPDKLDDLMALSALYRPGPMDNIPTYIDCKHGKKEPYYPHELLKDVLKETYGVIVYQEQVLEAAKVLAGYSLGSADLLRRAMGKKIKSEMDAQQKMFVEGAVHKGISAEKAEEIFALIAKFAGYGFNKAHAASYAVISYQTAYLKALFTPYFFVAALNLDINDHDKLAILIAEAKRMGVVMCKADINKCYGFFQLPSKNSKEILFGLGAIKGVTPAMGNEIAEERLRGGPFVSAIDFAERLAGRQLNRKSLEGLVKSGALDEMHASRAELLASIDNLIAHGQNSQKNKAQKQLGLFQEEAVSIIIKSSDTTCSFLDKSSQEFEALGQFLFFHPTKFYQEAISASGYKRSYELQNLPNGSTRIKIAAAVQKKDVRGSARGRFIALTLSDQYDCFEATLNKEETIKQYGDLLRPAQCLVFECEVNKTPTSTRTTILSAFSIEEVTGNMIHKLKLTVEDEQLDELLTFLRGKVSNTACNAHIDLILRYKERFCATVELPRLLHLNESDLEYLAQHYSSKT